MSGEPSVGHRTVPDLAASIPSEVHERVLELLSAPGFIQNPYPTYEYLHEFAPCWPAPDGGLIFASYEACRETRRNEVRDFGGRSTRPSMGWVQEESLIGTDPPEHTRLRALLNSAAFLPSAVRSLQDRLDAFTDQLLDRVVARGSMDLISEFARPLPTFVITELIGIPYESLEEWEPWANTIHRATGKPMFLEDQRRAAAPYFMEAQEAGKREAAWFAERIRERRSKGIRANDLITELCDSEDRGELTEAQVLGTLVLLIGAGHHTTVNLIGNGVLALLQHPDQLQDHAKDASLLPNAIEEMLRFDPPLQAGGRRDATHDIVLDGVLVEGGTPVTTIIGAANRDPRVFERPNEFDIHRVDAKNHLAFGFGTHFCLGSSLARAEGMTAISGLIERLPNLRLVDATPVYEDMYSLRGLASLRVAWDT